MRRALRPEDLIIETRSDSGEGARLAGLRDALRRRAERIHEDPQTNSVFSTAQDLFLALETGGLVAADLADMVGEAHGELAVARAGRLRTRHGGETLDAAWDALAARLEALAAEGWESYRAAMETPRGGVVFTGHPTYALSRELRAALAAHATSPDEATLSELRAAACADGRTWNAALTLEVEHQDAQAAIANAQAVLEAYAGLVYDVARNAFPDRWTELRPELPTLASWVGYDLDGRTDIDWSDSIALRLREKSAQLARYSDSLDRISDEHVDPASGRLADWLRRAGTKAAASADMFGADFSDPDALASAANALTEPDHEDVRATSVLLAAIDRLLHDAGDGPERQRDLLILRAVASTLQLGTARIHLRVNAAQIRSVIDRDLGLDAAGGGLGRRVLSELSAMAAGPSLRAVNFADLELEQSTARRLFMVCAQILKHVDADAVIRFLIAESENPAIVIAALYLAREYGVADRVDISPLFETPDALETGGRFIERLLAEPPYVDYVRGRGYLCIQLGFSDAGRFIGQIPAAMAVERLHNLIGRAVAPLAPEVGLLIFNTHGESMGRGGYPGPLARRFDHLLTPWARLRAQQSGLRLRHEVSFQGGDGFLHFATPALSRATLASFVLHGLTPPDPEAARDPFYLRTDLVWDFYRSLRAWHERLFDHRPYARLFTAFPTALVVKAGSRQVRRTSAGGPRTLRAISHNATLQQLAAPCNTASGIGSTLPREREAMIDLVAASPRMRSLFELAWQARELFSTPVLRAYGSAVSPDVWVSLAAHAAPERHSVYERIFRLFEDGAAAIDIGNIASRTSIDLNAFDQILARIDGASRPEDRREARLGLHALHAIRIALMMRALALVHALPPLSPRHATGTGEIIAMVAEGRLAEAIAALRQGYPRSADLPALDGRLGEPGHLAQGAGYDRLHATLIDPIEEIQAILHQITLAISHAYDAFG